MVIRCPWESYSFKYLKECQGATSPRVRSTGRTDYVLRKQIVSEHSWNSDRRLLTTDETWTLTTDTQRKGWELGGLCEGVSIWESLMSRLAQEACLLAFALASGSSLVSAKQAVRSVRCLLCTHRRGWGGSGEQAMGSKMQYHPPAGNPRCWGFLMPCQSATTRLCCWGWDLLGWMCPKIKTQYHA